MCRFVAYIGDYPKRLSDLLEAPNNSLINQSKPSKDGTSGLHADGFGMSWYAPNMGIEPGVYKSTQPAWNDYNLKHIANKIESNCFLAHIRASTIGDVTLSNCHPFYYQQYSFVHNGTIRNFELIRRKLLQQLDDDLFVEIKGQTDSETFFFFIMQLLRQHQLTLKDAVTRAIQWIAEAQNNLDSESFARLNISITDGKELIATRWASKRNSVLSLNYAINQDSQLIVASEELDHHASKWHEIPPHHMISFSLQDKTLNIEPLAI